ncbi:hypothetical protein [Paludisphaera sp.]|uniref:hypothetical protein n=1 Tax=Paludisphaera sp. TaxID=2017432 RepID=UPI00301C9397
MVRLLEEVKEAQNLKRGEITTAKNSTYDDIVESISKSLSNGWISTEAVTQVLEAAEIAGRQHVCVFEVAQEDLGKVRESLNNPATLNTQTTSLEEFWTIPLEPYTRILADAPDIHISKVVAVRKYWVEHETPKSEDYIEIIRKRERERAALIVKLDAGSRLLQFRVPIREQAPGVDTSSSVYAFVSQIVYSQYGDHGAAWLLRLRPFKIADAYKNIILNRDDFELHADTPENQYLRSSMSRKGAPGTGQDIRDFPEWVYDNGFARSSIKGTWKRDPAGVDVRMHYDRVKVSKELTRLMARLYFSKPYSDQDVEHVILRIREHF